MECDSRDAMACVPQFWDQLENRRGKDDEMSRRMWEVVETKARKVGVAKVERRREEAKEKEKTKKEENNRSKESGRGVGDLGWRGRSKEAGTRMLT